MKKNPSPKKSAPKSKKPNTSKRKVSKPKVKRPRELEKPAFVDRVVLVQQGLAWAEVGANTYQATDPQAGGIWCVIAPTPKSTEQLNGLVNNTLRSGTQRPQRGQQHLLKMIV